MFSPPSWIVGAFPAGLCVGQAVPIHPVVSQLISKVVPGYPCLTAAVSLPAFLDASAGKLGSHPGGGFAFAPARRPRLSRRKKVTVDHPIFARWPAQYPDRLQLFSTSTPNGVKVGIMLEETSLPYEPHRIDIMANETHDPAFLALNPNGKIPAIYDPDGPSGTPLALFESGAILLYLADKTGQFISADPNTRYETIQWVMWQMGGVGPMFGQVGFFNKFAGKTYEDKRPRDRYATESARLLGVLDQRLAGRDWVMGADYSIADISLLGWVRNLIGFYEARDLVGFNRFLHVQAWLTRGLTRPAVQRGLQVTAG